MNTYLTTPIYNRRKHEKYTLILSHCGESTGKELIALVQKWNEANPGNCTSPASVYRMRREVAECGGSVPFGRYGQTRKRSVSFEWFDKEIGSASFLYFVEEFMRQSCPPGRACYDVARGYAVEQWKIKYGSMDGFEDTFPAFPAFERRLKAEYSPADIYEARNGKSKYNSKYGNFINRDYTQVRAGDIWVGDHRQLDIKVRMPDGSFCRPWLTGWCDFKTRKFLSASLHADAPSVDHILMTFADGVQEFGTPKAVYIDNGKDYVSKNFGGGSDADTTDVSVLRILGVEKITAIRYNPQAKTIERVFNDVKNRFDRFMPGFTGGHPAERPENHTEELKGGGILTMEQAESNLQYFLTEVFNATPSNGKNLNGKSPNQVFFTEYNRSNRVFVSSDALDMLRTRAGNIMTISRNGMRCAEYNDYYYADWMEGRKGTKAYWRRGVADSADHARVWVFDAATHSLLGEAKLGRWNSPALAGEKLEGGLIKKQPADGKQQQKNDAKRGVAQRKRRDNERSIEALKYAALSATNGESAPPTAVQSSTKTIKRTRFDERENRTTGTDGAILYFQKIGNKYEDYIE